MRLFTRPAILSVLMLLLFLASCDKPEPTTPSRKYMCKIVYNYWTMNSVNIDSTYYQLMDLKQEGNNIIVLNTPIPIECLTNQNEYFFGNANSNMQVLFNEDSLFITRSNGGLGGGETWNYTGVKL